MQPDAKPPTSPNERCNPYEGQRADRHSQACFPANAERRTVCFRRQTPRQTSGRMDRWAGRHGTIAMRPSNYQGAGPLFRTVFALRHRRSPLKQPSSTGTSRHAVDFRTERSMSLQRSHASTLSGGLTWHRDVDDTLKRAGGLPPVGRTSVGHDAVHPEWERANSGNAPPPMKSGRLGVREVTRRRTGTATVRWRRTGTAASSMPGDWACKRTIRSAGRLQVSPIARAGRIRPVGWRAAHRVVRVCRTV